MTAVADALETGRVSSHLNPEGSFELSDHPLPTGREEVWRFTPLKRVAALLEGAQTSDVLDWQVELPEQVTLEPISLAQARDRAVEPPVDRISALAAHDAHYGTLLSVPADLELSVPIQITGHGTGQRVAEHWVIDIGAHAKATIVFRYTGSATYREKLDLHVGEGAECHVVTLQEWDDDALHGAQRSVSVGRDAQVRTVTVSVGGDVVRIVENSNFAGPGGSVEQYGLYFADAGQHLEHRLFIDHNQPHTRSRVSYKGALQGDGAHSVWVGNVLIRKVAEGIDTYEENRNLLLTDGCQADSVPNLEIETGEIEGAGHASATGRFDDEQLFYLRSRGIGEAEARRLVVHGFFNELIRKIGVPELEERLFGTVEAELAAAEPRAGEER